MAKKWKVRNRTLLMLWLVYIVAFLDRANFSVAAPFIAKELNLSASQIGLAMSAFIIGYGWFQVIGGIMADRIGSRKTMLIALTWWTAFTAATGMASGIVSMIAIRFFFGVGEAFQVPAAYKTVSVWFPKAERLRATSMMSGATALAPAVTPLIVVWFVHNFGWRVMFCAFAIPGALVAFLVYRHLYSQPSEHPQITEAEKLEIYEGKSAAARSKKISVIEAFKVPKLLMMCVIYLVYDVTYWGFFSWMPSYLVDVRHFAMVKMGVYASLPYLAGFVGLMLANTIGTKIFRGNKAYFLSAIWMIGAVSLYAAFEASSAEACIALMAVTAGCGIFMAQGPFWALVTEKMPSEAMGFLSSVINGAGKIGGSLAPIVIGFSISATGGSYRSAFALMAGCLVICAGLVLFIREKASPAESSARPVESPSLKPVSDAQ
ncbi:MFS transporter [Caballeronia sp. LP006]|uniref:MFS transporter n=1 Tax=Caballeronia sp. LP006 TaxID=3038552 RepID=UPI002856654E|nr:MFS transporter [Caballeronia sp. LP006]MDR5832325.1 MFS transporter [Caballeronia sp. LP006]